LYTTEKEQWKEEEEEKENILNIIVYF